MTNKNPESKPLTPPEAERLRLGNQRLESILRERPENQTPEYRTAVEALRAAIRKRPMWQTEAQILAWNDRELGKFDEATL